MGLYVRYLIGGFFLRALFLKVPLGLGRGNVLSHQVWRLIRPILLIREQLCILITYTYACKKIGPDHVALAYLTGHRYTTQTIYVALH